MQNKYIIYNKIEFVPSSKKLRRLDYPDDIVILNSPASRCFLLLIQRKGHIVTQQEFMNEVWVKSGVLVCANTFYQNISILRKGLRKIGVHEDIIVTIPRVGLTLSDNCVINLQKDDIYYDFDSLKENEKSITKHLNLETEDKIKGNSKVSLSKCLAIFSPKFIKMILKNFLLKLASFC